MRRMTTRRRLPFPHGDPELMSRALGGLIVYEGLPLADGGAHELGRRDPVLVWRGLATFLDECADIQGSAATVSLQEMGWTSPTGSRGVRRRISERLGRPHRSGSGLGPGRLRDYFWGADPELVEETLRWLGRLERLPEVYHSPAVFLGYEAWFRLLDPVSRTPFPNQGGRCYGEQDIDGHGLVALGESRLFARLSERPSCSLVLSLPFPEVDDALRGYVAGLQRRLPFPFSSDHWTRWRLDDARSLYRPSAVQVTTNEGGRGRRRSRRGRPPAHTSS